MATQAPEDSPTPVLWFVCFREMHLCSQRSTVGNIVTAEHPLVWLDRWSRRKQIAPFGVYVRTLTFYRELSVAEQAELRDAGLRPESLQF